MQKMMYSHISTDNVSSISGVIAEGARFFCNGGRLLVQFSCSPAFKRVGMEKETCFQLYSKALLMVTKALSLRTSFEGRLRVNKM